MFSVENSQTGPCRPTAASAAIRIAHRPGAGPGGDDGRDPGRGRRARGPRRRRRPVPALHRPRPRDGPSALYRYFDGRDALLSALILAAYEALAAEAERAARRGGGELQASGGDAERWLAVPRALRGWALAHPHEWGLIFGTPVPGYQAPEDTVEPYARWPLALVRPLVGGRGGGPAPPGRASTAESRTSSRAAVAPVTRGAPPRDAGREGGARRSRPGRPSSAPSASRSSGTGATRCSTRSCSSRPPSRDWRRRSASLRTAHRRTPDALEPAQRRRVAQRLRPCPQLLEPVLGDPLGHGPDEVEDERSQLGQLLAGFLQLDLRERERDVHPVRRCDDRGRASPGFDPRSRSSRRGKQFFSDDFGTPPSWSRHGRARG